MINQDRITAKDRTDVIAWKQSEIHRTELGIDKGYNYIYELKKEIAEEKRKRKIAFIKNLFKLRGKTWA